MTKYNLDVVTVQEVGWDKGGLQPADDYIFFYGNANVKHNLGTGFTLYKGIRSTFKRVEFVSDRMSYVIHVGVILWF
jgi:hypothetical protein